MTFQFKLLQSEHAKRFTSTVLKEARRVFKEIRMSLVEPAPDMDPFRIPSFDSKEELVFFLALVGDDDWLCKHADLMQLHDAKGAYLGLTLRKDRKMWLSEEGREHLKATDLRAFTPLSYVKKQLADYLA